VRWVAKPLLESIVDLDFNAIRMHWIASNLFLQFKINETETED
jgi:hypothetical protein